MGRIPFSCLFAQTTWEQKGKVCSRDSFSVVLLVRCTMQRAFVSKVKQNCQSVLQRETKRLWQDKMSSQQLELFDILSCRGAYVCLWKIRMEDLCHDFEQLFPEKNERSTTMNGTFVLVQFSCSAGEQPTKAPHSRVSCACSYFISLLWYCCVFSHWKVVSQLGSTFSYFSLLVCSVLQES